MFVKLRLLIAYKTIICFSKQIYSF